MLALVDGRKKKFDLAFFEEQFSGIVLVHKKTCEVHTFWSERCFFIYSFCFFTCFDLRLLIGEEFQRFFRYTQCFNWLCFFLLIGFKECRFSSFSLCG